MNNSDLKPAENKETLSQDVNTEKDKVGSGLPPETQAQNDDEQNVDVKEENGLDVRAVQVDGEKTKRRRRRKKKKGPSDQAERSEDSKEVPEKKEAQIQLSPEEAQTVLKQNEYLMLSHKRLRALRKRMDRIERVEKAVTSGQKINCDQEAALASKPTVQAIMAEMDKLHSMLTKHALSKKLEQKRSSMFDDEKDGKTEHSEMKERANVGVGANADSPIIKAVEHKEIQTEDAETNSNCENIYLALDLLAATKIVQRFQQSENVDNIPSFLKGKATKKELCAVADLGRTVEDRANDTHKKLKLLAKKSSSIASNDVTYERIFVLIYLVKDLFSAQCPNKMETEKQEMKYEACDFMVPSQIHPNGEGHSQILSPKIGEALPSSAKGEAKLELIQSETSVSNEISAQTTDPSTCGKVENAKEAFPLGNRNNAPGRRGRSRGGRGGGTRNVNHTQGHRPPRFKCTNGVPHPMHYQMHHPGANHPPHYISHVPPPMHPYHAQVPHHN